MRLWNIRSRIIFFGVVLVSFLALFMLGYYFIKGYIEGQWVGVIDCIYWTFITLSTLGSYPEGIALTSSIGKLWTVITVLSGLIIIFVGVPSIAAPWLEKKLERAVAPRSIPIPGKEHVIVCGYTDVGRQVVEELKIHDVPFVVIDPDEGRKEHFNKHRIPHLIADPTETKVLRDAHIESALSLVVSAEDSTNAFVCLTASKLRPDVRIIANLEDEDNERVLLQAGANKAFSSRSIAGLLLAKRALGQYDIDVVNRSGFLGGLQIRQYTIGKDSKVVGRTLRSIHLGKKTGANVLGIWKKGELIFNPPPHQPLPEGTILVVMGTKQQHAAVSVELFGEAVS